MMNELQFTYTPMGLPNVLMQEERGKEPKYTIVHPFLHSLIQRIAKAKPGWKLVACNRIVVPDNAPSLANKFIIYEGNEELGRVWRDYNYGYSCDVVAIDNTRLKAARQRGDCTRTKDTTKAFKIVTKTFGAKTTSELVSEGASAARQAATNITNAAEREHAQALYRLTDTAQKFMRDRWDEFTDFARERGIAQTTLDKLPETEQADQDAQALRDARANNNDIVVVLRGSEYILSHKGSVQVLPQDQLSPHLKRCVGMLKLAEDKQFIPGMGVRASSTVFYVLPEEGEDQNGTEPTTE